MAKLSFKKSKGRWKEGCSNEFKIFEGNQQGEGEIPKNSTHCYEGRGRCGMKDGKIGLYWKGEGLAEEGEKQSEMDIRMARKALKEEAGAAWRLVKWASIEREEAPKNARSIA